MIQLVEFYIETLKLDDARIVDAEGREIPCQVSPHPRGRMISFMDTFAAGEVKEYSYFETEKSPEVINTRQCYIGAERVKDIVNDYDPESWHLPYYYENSFFRLAYRPGEGITSFIDRRTGREMLGKGEAPLFTPMYEVRAET